MSAIILTRISTFDLGPTAPVRAGKAFFPFEEEC